MIWYVHRRDDGSIASAHEPNSDGSCPMPDYCPEALDDTKDADLIAYQAPILAARAAAKPLT